MSMVSDMLSGTRCYGSARAVPFERHEDKC